MHLTASIPIQPDQRNETSFAEENQGWKVEAEIEGHGFQHSSCCLVNSSLVRYELATVISCRSSYLIFLVGVLHLARPIWRN
jgi:hypothetical protein